MKCDEVKPALFGFLFEQLDPAVRSEIDAHLSECGSCREALLRIFSDRGLDHDKAEEARELVVRLIADAARENARGAPPSGLPPAMPPAWGRSGLLDIAACAAAVLFVILAAFLVRTRKPHVAPAPAPPAIVMSLEIPRVVLSDSDVLCRVCLRRRGSTAPVPNAQVTFSIASPLARLGAFKTGADGRCEAVFHAPRIGPGKYLLVIETDSPNGRASATEEITFSNPAQMTVFTDRSAYEPGDEALLFCMLCRRTGPVADGAISVRLANVEGKLLFARNCKTAANGIAEVRIPLDESLRPGVCTATITSDELSAGLDLVVRPEIPRSEFEGSFELSKRHFKPGEAISGRFRLATAWGEAVCGRRVCVSLSKRGAAPQPSDFSCEAMTDGDGFAKFAFPAGGGGNDDDSIAEFMLSARLRDPSDGLPISFCPIFVSSAVFIVTPVEGCARALRGAEAELRWRVSRADGSPVAIAAVSVRERFGRIQELETDWKGEFAFRQKYDASDADPAEWMDVTVRDSAGETTTVRRVPIDVRAPSGFGIMTDRDSYTAGETIRASVSTGAGPENVRIELRVAGTLQVAGSMTVKADKTPALFEWPLPGWACGPMELRMSPASGGNGREAKATFTVAPRFAMSAGESAGGGATTTQVEAQSGAGWLVCAGDATRRGLALGPNGSPKVLVSSWSPGGTIGWVEASGITGARTARGEKPRSPEPVVSCAWWMAGLAGLLFAAAAALSVRSLLKSWQEWLWRFFAFVGLFLGIQLVLVSLLRWFAPESPRLADSPFLAYAVSGGLNVPLWLCSAVSLFLAAFVGDRLPSMADRRPGRAALVMLALGGLCFAPAALVTANSSAWVLPMLSALYAVAVVCVLTYEGDGVPAFFRLSPIAFLLVVTVGTEIVCLAAVVRVRDVPKAAPVVGEPRRGAMFSVPSSIQCAEVKAFPHGVSELTDIVSGAGSGRCDAVSVSGAEVPPGGGIGAVCGIANCMGLPHASSLVRVLPSADARLFVPSKFGAGKDALVQVVITNPTGATVMASIELVPGERLRLVGDPIKGMNVEARTRRAAQFTVTGVEVSGGAVLARVKLDGRMIERRAFVDVVSAVESGMDVQAGRLDSERTVEFEARGGWAQSGGMLRCGVFGGAECAVLEGCMDALDSRGTLTDDGDCIAAAARIALEAWRARCAAGVSPSQGVPIAELDAETSGRTWRAYQRLISFMRKDGLFALDSKDGRGSAVATAFALRALQRVDVSNGKANGNVSVADSAATALRQGFDKDSGWRDDAFAARAGVKDAENAGLLTTSLVVRALASTLPKGSPVLSSAEGLIASHIRGDTNPLALAAALDALMALNPSASAIRTALARVESLRRGTAGRCWWPATEGSAASGGWDRMSTVLILGALWRGGHWKNDVDAGMMFLVGDIWTRRDGEDPCAVLTAALLSEEMLGARSSDRSDVSDRSDAVMRTDVFMNGTLAWSCGGTGAEWSDSRDLRDAVLDGPNRIRLVPAAPPKSGGSVPFFVLRRTEPGRVGK